MSRRAREHTHLATEVPRDLDHDVRGSAEPVESDAVAGTRLAQVEGAVSDDARAEERRRVLVRELLRDRVGERLEKDMIAVRLTPDVKMLALASPDYLSRRGEPKTPADLHRHACINWRFPGSGRIYHWRLHQGHATNIETGFLAPTGGINVYFRS